MDEQDIVILAAKRTAMGNMLGSLSSLTAPELAAVSHEACLNESKLSPGDIDEVIMGCVLQAGIGQAPARQSAIKAGIPDSVPSTTINKMCGSGMKAVMMGADAIRAGNAKFVLAGGMESMSNAPYLLAKARTGYRLGHGEIKDHMFLDGLEDAYQKGKLMGVFAEKTAEKYHFTREAQDNFARNSMTKAIEAIEKGFFEKEIVPVTIKDKKGETVVMRDESPDAKKLSKMADLKPAFKTDGTVTAANSSSISDGAASLLITSKACADKKQLKPIAKIVAYASNANEPEWFTTAPVGAIKKVMERANWTPDSIDLYEINEAFAVVTMAAMHDLHIPEAKVNINGGACALGHPIGASGARVLVTLIHNLQRLGLKRGIAALCIGGGEATAMAIELI